MWKKHNIRYIVLPPVSLSLGTFVASTVAGCAQRVEASNSWAQNPSQYLPECFHWNIASEFDWLRRWNASLKLNHKFNQIRYPHCSLSHSLTLSPLLFCCSKTWRLKRNSSRKIQPLYHAFSFVLLTMFFLTCVIWMCKRRILFNIVISWTFLRQLFLHKEVSSQHISTGVSVEQRKQGWVSYSYSYASDPLHYCQDVNTSRGQDGTKRSHELELDEDHESKNHHMSFLQHTALL